MKKGRLRLEPDRYRKLRLEILKRDRWRCQWCNRMQNLQVHHVQFRSQMGADEEPNLITLCAACHKKIHD
jgi:5-methylcytosine-specific restriction endonuclease McrA